MDSTLQTKNKSRSIETELSTSYLDYAMSVIVGRALPDVRDGFKPVHRRVLFSMHELSNSHDKPYKKSARIVGEVLGKYHPHGDTAIYDSLVRMAQEFSLRYTLVDGQGNFGSIDGDNAAAMRYTEVRMQKMAGEMLADIEKETVDYSPNFDGTLQEPKVMPSRIPNLLINGSSGIAVGMATNMPPHNLGEICDAIAALLNNWELDDLALSNFVRGPDFPTGGIILGRAGILQAYTKGRGSIRIRGVAEIKEHKKDKSRQTIIISEIPYQVNKSDFVKHIAELVRDKKIEGISDVADYSDKKGIEVAVEVKKGSNAEIVLNQLYSKTALQTSFGINNLALVDSQPKVLSLRELIVEFINHRREVIRRRCSFDLNVAKDRKHILEGLKIALSDIDKIISTIKKSNDVFEAKNALMTGWKMSEKQANAILEMRLSKLTSLEREKIDEENLSLAKLIDELISILADSKKIDAIILKETNEIKDKYADERRTKIIDWDGEEINDLDLIPDESSAIILTENDYIKRISLGEYRSQKRGGKGVIGTETKEEDVIKDILVASTHSTLLIFTHDGMVHWLPVYKIPETSRYSKGKAIVNLLEIKEGKVSSCIAVREFKESESLVMATRKGVVKRTTLDAYSRPRRGGIRAITLREGDSLIGVRKTNGNTAVLLATTKGSSIRFSEQDVREIGRTGQGVKGITLRKDDSVVDMALCTSPTFLTVCENGYGKRTQIEDYRLQGRGGMGIINIKTSERNGAVVAVRAVSDEDEIILLSSSNKAIRIPASEISVLGRNTQGVRLMRLEDGEKIVAMEHIRVEDQGDGLGANGVSNSDSPKPPASGDSDLGDSGNSGSTNSGDSESADSDVISPADSSDSEENLDSRSADSESISDSGKDSGSSSDSVELVSGNIIDSKTNSDSVKLASESTTHSDLNKDSKETQIKETSVPLRRITQIQNPTTQEKKVGGNGSKDSNSFLDSDGDESPRFVTEVLEDEADKKTLSDFFSKGKGKR